MTHTSEERKSLRYNRLTEEQVKKIIKLRSNGLTQKLLAMRFSVSQPTIVKILKENEGER